MTTVMLLSFQLSPVLWNTRIPPVPYFVTFLLQLSEASMTLPYSHQINDSALMFFKLERLYFTQSLPTEFCRWAHGTHLRTENSAMQGVCGPREPPHHHLESRLMHIFRTRPQVVWKRSTKWSLAHHLKYGSWNIQGSGRYLVFIKAKYLWGAKTKYFKHSLIWFL